MPFQKFGSPEKRVEVEGEQHKIAADTTFTEEDREALRKENAPDIEPQPDDQE